MKRTPLLLLIIVALCTAIFVGAAYPVYAAKLFVGWTAPVQNSDGTPLTDLTGYRIEWGSCTASHTVSTVQGGINAAATATRSPIYPTNLNPVCVQIFAVNSAGVMSAPVYANSIGVPIPSTLSKPTH
jgi:hypothetical protein